MSPTLSAITAGFLGSSSGIPASTLPTKSAPTSAPLVKIPPPSLAKIEINDAPNPRATKALITSLSFTLRFIKITFTAIIFINTYLAAQNYQELQKLQSEYKKALERQSLQKPFEISEAEKTAKSTDLINDTQNQNHPRCVLLF